MDSNIKERNPLEILHLIFYVLGVAIWGFEWIVLEGSDVSAFVGFEGQTFLKYIVLACFTISVAFKPEGRILMIPAIVVAIAWWQISGYLFIAMFISMLMAAYAIDFDKLVSISAIVVFVCCTLVVGLCLIGILPDYVLSHWGKTAHSCGFYYYSNLSVLVFFFSMSFIYKKKLSLITVLSFLAMNGIAYVVTTLRLTFYMSLIFIVATCAIDRIDFEKVKSKVLIIISTLLFIFTLFGNYVAIWLQAHGNEKINKLDYLLGGRLTYSLYAIHNVGTSNFGRVMFFRQGQMINGQVDYSDFFFVDNGYIFNLIEYGNYFFALLMCIFLLCLIYASLIKDKKLLLWLITIVLMSSINDMLTNIVVNPAILVLPMAVERCIELINIQLDNKLLK